MIVVYEEMALNMSFFSTASADKPHILIVEDERHIGIGLKFNCEAEGYRATLVGDGLNALRLISEDPGQFELIVLDLMLPGMSGYKVLEEVRKVDVQIPVLILSARTLSEDRTRGFDLGADQYLMKPFELPELLSRIRNLLQRRGYVQKTAGTQDEIYQFQGHIINFTRHEVTKNGEAKSLTPLEFELLRYFVRNEGAVVTRAQWWATAMRAARRGPSCSTKSGDLIPRPRRGRSTISSCVCDATSSRTRHGRAIFCQSAASDIAL